MSIAHGRHRDLTGKSISLRLPIGCLECLFDGRHGALTASKSILLCRASIIRNLYARPPLRRILEKVNIRALIEAMMRGFSARRAIVIMYIRESVITSESLP